jgi:hypothetical protein
MATGKDTPFGDVRSVANQTGAVFSPDGKWVAYAVSERAGITENYVFLQPFPATGARYQISQSGENGHHPLWSRDQKELYYVPLLGQFVVRAIVLKPTVSFGNPIPVPRTFPVAAPVTPRTFDITADGRIIGVFARDDAAERQGRASSSSVLGVTTSELIVVLNWFEELRTKVPNK